MSYVLIIYFTTYAAWNGIHTQKFKTKNACEKVLNQIKEDHNMSFAGSKCLEVDDQ